MNSGKNRRMPKRRSLTEPPFDYGNRAIGKRMRTIRELHGLSQTAMAAKIGITGSALSRLEAGENRIDVDNALKVFELFGFDLTYIYTGLRGGLSETTRNLLDRGPPPSASSESA